MADIHPPKTYQYTPSSAQSTRHLLDSTSPSTAAPTSAISENQPTTFRPSAPTRKSTNYAEADATARAAIADYTTGVSNGEAQQSPETGDRQEKGRRGSVGWKPNVGRKQSWSQQDLKRVMQMSGVMEGAGKGESAPGFTEVERGCRE